MFTVVLTWSLLIKVFFFFCLITIIISWFSSDKIILTRVLLYNTVICFVIAIAAILFISLKDYFYMAIGFFGASLIFYSSKKEDKETKKNNPQCKTIDK